MKIHFIGIGGIGVSALVQYYNDLFIFSYKKKFN